MFTRLPERATKQGRNRDRMRTAVTHSWLQVCPSRPAINGEGSRQSLGGAGEEKTKCQLEES